MTGSPPGADRIGAARSLVDLTGATVLLKGPTTIVASPGQVPTLVDAGDERLATAGTGDVLSGILGAFLAQGLTPHAAAVAAAFVHGRAGRRCAPVGAVAGDLVDEIPSAIGELA